MNTKNKDLEILVNLVETRIAGEHEETFTRESEDRQEDNKQIDIFEDLVASSVTWTLLQVCWELMAPDQKRSATRIAPLTADLTMYKDELSILEEDLSVQPQDPELSRDLDKTREIIQKLETQLAKIEETR